jgi:hypothetical protein
MTLGCGGYGGNITSDNISPRHLLNIKRLAYETRPLETARASRPAVGPPAAPALPKVPQAPITTGIEPASMGRQFDQVLGVPPAPPAPAPNAEAAGIVEFVCEEDVRLAIRQGRKILVGERTIVTPAARDLAASSHVLVEAGWPRS